jgi:hypothetical protein
MTKLRVLVLSFPDFTDISIIQANFSSPNGGAFKVQEWQAFRFLYFFPIYPTDALWVYHKKENKTIIFCLVLYVK